MNSFYKIALSRMIEFNKEVANSLNTYVEREYYQEKFFWLLHNYYMSNNYKSLNDNLEILDLAKKIGFKVVNGEIELLDTIKKFENDNYIVTTYIEEHTFTYQRSTVSHIKRAKGDFWTGHIKQKHIDEFIRTALIMEKCRIQCLRYMYICSVFKPQLDFGANEALIKAIIKDSYMYNTTIKISKDLYPALYSFFLETRCFSLTENEVKHF